MSQAGSDRPPFWERVSQRPHIVILTDDPDLRDFLGQGLLLAGFWTSAIASGIQAIEVFRMRRFDLIIMDAHIRGLSALEIVHRLRGTGTRGGEPLTLIPIAIIDADPDPAARQELSWAGDVAFLDPPLELEDVANRLMASVAAWRAANPGEPWADASVPQSRGPRDDSSI